MRSRRRRLARNRRNARARAKRWLEERGLRAPFIWDGTITHLSGVAFITSETLDYEWPPPEEWKRWSAASGLSMNEYSEEQIALGKKNYEAYAAKVGGKTHDGQEMPKWDETPGERCLTQKIRDGWTEGAVRVAATAIAAHIARGS